MKLSKFWIYYHKDDAVPVHRNDNIYTEVRVWRLAVSGEMRSPGTNNTSTTLGRVSRQLYIVFQGKSLITRRCVGLATLKLEAEMSTNTISSPALESQTGPIRTG